MILLAVKAFVSSLGWAKIGLIIAAALAVITAGGIIYHQIWERGYARAIADIADQDNKAIKRASERRSALLDCRARDGMRWDQSTGQCVGR